MNDNPYRTPQSGTFHGRIGLRTKLLAAILIPLAAVLLTFDARMWSKYSGGVAEKTLQSKVVGFAFDWSWRDGP